MKIGDKVKILGCGYCGEICDMVGSEGIIYEIIDDPDPETGGYIIVNAYTSESIFKKSGYFKPEQLELVK